MKHAEEKFMIYDLAIKRILNTTKQKILKEISKRKVSFALHIAEKLDISAPRVAFHINGNINQDKYGLVDLGMIEKGEELIKGKVPLSITPFGRYVLQKSDFEGWL
jgi:predicted transcriptional regulator